MIIRGRFLMEAPFFGAQLSFGGIHGYISLLADTGASRTTILDYDAKDLGLNVSDLKPAPHEAIGIGGRVRSFIMKNAMLAFTTNEGLLVLEEDLTVVQHELRGLPKEEVASILRIPSLLGRDIINQFRLLCDFPAGIVQLEK